MASRSPGHGLQPVALSESYESISRPTRVAVATKQALAKKLTTRAIERQGLRVQTQDAVPTPDIRGSRSATEHKDHCIVFPSPGILFPSASEVDSLHLLLLPWFQLTQFKPINQEQ